MNKNTFSKMPYRKKVVLAMLYLFDGKLNHTDFQKLLFLFVNSQEKPSYDFMPYKYGCYSAQANHDLMELCKKGLIIYHEKKWQLLYNDDFSTLLTDTDKECLIHLKKRFRYYRGQKLIKYIYKNYPEFAIHSEIADKFFTKEELIKIKNQYKKYEPTIFTIGYEGKSIEKYIFQLIKNDIRILCDIRKNACSRKYGFSKNQLKYLLNNVGIEYYHFPSLGISSQERKGLKTYNDYNNLFLRYSTTYLKENKKDLEVIISLYKEKKRIALTCFEANHKYCHRFYTVNEIKNIIGEPLNIQHL